MRELTAGELTSVSGGGLLADVEQVGSDFVSGFSAGGAITTTSRVLWNAGKIMLRDTSVGLVDGAPEGGVVGAAVGGLIGLGVGIYQVW